MSEWKRRRFWKLAGVVEVPDGYSVELDGKRLMTPAKAPLHLPTRALAQAVAEEWQSQDDDIDPRSMPVTQSANSAIDKVAPQRAEVADMLADYGDSDLLCYRAVTPAELAERQAAAWDPLLDWAAQALGARLETVEGVMHRPQPDQAIRRLRAQVHAMDPFRLAAFHDLVSLTGSLILGFAASHEILPPQTTWDRSRIDEDWQAEHWGEDEEAARSALLKREAFFHAVRFFKLVTTPE